ncbi:MAG: hypothetical protein K2I96_20940 [Lachnospiraceae bacterium]|nr:hypothetical protein [Lachnospiraceae bacterium]
MKDYFDQTLNRMQGDTITDEKSHYYRGVIDSYFELGFLSEYERGELAIQLIDLHLEMIRKNQKQIEQRENKLLLMIGQEGGAEYASGQRHNYA